MYGKTEKFLLAQNIASIIHLYVQNKRKGTSVLRRISAISWVFFSMLSTEPKIRRFELQGRQTQRLRYL